MHQHGPTDLTGPLRGTRAWWQGTGAGPDESSEGTGTLTRNDNRDDTDEPIRTELVERLRQEIAGGAYDTQEKWEAALDRLLDRIDEE